MRDTTRPTLPDSTAVSLSYQEDDPNSRRWTPGPSRIPHPANEAVPDHRAPPIRSRKSRHDVRHTGGQWNHRCSWIPVSDRNKLRRTNTRASGYLRERFETTDWHFAWIHSSTPLCSRKAWHRLRLWCPHDTAQERIHHRPCTWIVTYWAKAVPYLRTLVEDTTLSDGARPPQRESHTTRYLRGLPHLRRLPWQKQYKSDMLTWAIGLSQWLRTAMCVNKKWEHTLTDKLVPFLNHMRIHTYICHSVGKWDITLTEKSWSHFWDRF